MEALAHTFAELETLSIIDADAVAARVQELTDSMHPSFAPRCVCDESNASPEDAGCVWNDWMTLDAWLGTLPADPEDGEYDWDAADRAYDAYRDALNGVA